MEPQLRTNVRKDKIPVNAGVGLRAQHYRSLLELQPKVGWLEFHPENYFGDGGAPLYFLERLRELYPLSMHGVGLSLGSADPLSKKHLEKLKNLIIRFEPDLISEHLSWGSINGIYLNDLLPLPYTEETLDHFCAHVSQTQDYLQRRILIENPSSYLGYSHSTIPEEEFLVAIAKRTGCGLLLDINNVYVSSVNHGIIATEYLDKIPADRVGEIHLAGHSKNAVGNQSILIDDHGSQVCDEVWKLFEYYCQTNNNTPVLIEWDSDIPELDILLGEAKKAQMILEKSLATIA